MGAQYYPPVKNLWKKTCPKNLLEAKCDWPGIPIPTAYSIGQPDLEVGNPVHSGGLELDDLQGPHQPKPFYDPMTNHPEHT